jgi:hypothetical protein
MKKITLLIASFAMIAGSYAQSEIAPTTTNNYSFNYDKALWDIQLDVDPSATASLAGVAWTGSEFWAAVWNTGDLESFNAAGVSTGLFTIAGITGARSITSDGTSMYIGTAANSIYVVDKTTRMLTATINVPVGDVRYCTYDPTLDGGSGGFWTGNFTTDWTAVSMTGATLSSIPAATHGMSSVYGLAYDPYSVGGPFLWAYDQGAAGTGADIVQLSMAGTQTGVVHNSQTDLQGGNVGIAGGLFITNNFMAGTTSMIGLNQGISLFAYELTSSVGINDVINANTFTIYPNPTSSVSTITFTLSESSSVSMNVINSIGELVHSETTTTMNTGIQKINFDGTELPNGVYFVNLTIGDQVISKKVSILK